MQSFSSRVLAWFDIHGRKHLPWQQNPTPYVVWVSEIMLQQTQVATVIPYFNKFIARFPDIKTLADSSTDEVLAYWAGLGYYSRARNLHKAAQTIRDQYNGKFPTEFSQVIALSGIGESTAGAILSLSLNQPHTILDGNVKRVLSRHQLIDGIPNQTKTLKKQWAVAKQFTPIADCNQYTQAMMDLGAMICTRSKPKCDECPVYVDCGAYQENKIADYPNKKPKKILPEKQISMLLITDSLKVYLEKRPNNGIWGGLWSLPEIELDDQGKINQTAIDEFIKKHQLSVESQRILPNYQHIFTHYKLHITPIVIGVKQLDDGFSPEHIKTMGLPTPIKKILMENIIS